MTHSRRYFIKSSAGLALMSALPGCASLSTPGRTPVAFADIPRSEYGFATTADEVLADIDLSGKTVLITGCNSGLGYQSMRAMAAKGAHVIGTARTQEKADTACKSVQGMTTPLVCELTNMDSVVACADAVNKIGAPIDILICNAGVMALPKLEQVDVSGVMLERQFVINHLGHYLLTRKVLPQVQAADTPRIVMVSSLGYTLAPEGGIQFDNLSGDNGYQAFKNYGQTKLANILFAKELDRRYFDAGISSNAIHPGLVSTNLGRYITGRMPDPNKPLRKGQKTAVQGASTQVYVGTDPRLEGVSGFYFEDCNPVATKGGYADDPALALKLWDVSEELVQAYL